MLTLPRVNFAYIALFAFIVVAILASVLFYFYTKQGRDHPCPSLNSGVDKTGQGSESYVTEINGITTLSTKACIVSVEKEDPDYGGNAIRIVIGYQDNTGKLLRFQARAGGQLADGSPVLVGYCEPGQEGLASCSALTAADLGTKIKTGQVTNVDIIFTDSLPWKTEFHAQKGQGFIGSFRDAVKNGENFPFQGDDKSKILQISQIGW